MSEHHADLVDADDAGRCDHPDDDAKIRSVLNTLNNLRAAQNLTQRDIAHRMGLRQPTIAGYGARGASPRARTLLRYARACGAELDFTLTLLDEPRDPAAP